MSKETQTIVHPTNQMHGCHILVPRNVPLKNLEKGLIHQRNFHVHCEITFVPHFDWSVDAPTTAYFLCVKKNFCFSVEAAMLAVDKWRMTERMVVDRLIINALVIPDQNRSLCPYCHPSCESG